MFMTRVSEDLECFEQVWCFSSLLFMFCFADHKFISQQAFQSTSAYSRIKFDSYIAECKYAGTQGGSIALFASANSTGVLDVNTGDVRSMSFLTNLFKSCLSH